MLHLSPHVALQEQYILLIIKLNSSLLHKIFSLQLTGLENYALYSTSALVFHMKVFQAMLSSPLGGKLTLSAYNFAKESDEFTT